MIEDVTNTEEFFKDLEPTEAEVQKVFNDLPSVNMELREDLRRWSQDDLAYAAGFVDGEGCFHIKSGRQTAVSCSNTNPEVIQWFGDTFGGSISHASQRRKTNHRRMWSWQVVSQDALRFCSAITPYLKVKQEEALGLILFQQTMGTIGGHVSEETKEERQRINLRLKDLKRKIYE